MILQASVELLSNSFVEDLVVDLLFVDEELLVVHNIGRVLVIFELCGWFLYQIAKLGAPIR